MHILAHVLAKTRFIDLQYFVNISLTLARLKTYNCVFLETMKVEVIWLCMEHFNYLL